MSTSRLRNLALALLLTGLIVAPLSLAADKSAKQQQLQTLLKKIDKLKQLAASTGVDGAAIEEAMR